MKNLYLDTSALDKRAVEIYGLSEEILMENAASAVEKAVRKKIKKGLKILALIGAGNNAADGFCALRKLALDYECYFLEVFSAQNSAKNFQKNAALKVGVKRVEDLIECECVIDAIFGSGLNRALDDNLISLLERVNSLVSYKIAVDVPSGLDKFGNILGACFLADITICMGGLKLGCYLDGAKDFVGRIKRANLGLSAANFEVESEYKLLKKSDLKLPFRDKKNTNKGDFGHTYILSGAMSGAARIAGLSAMAIGSGLVSVVSGENSANLEPVLMLKNSLKDAKVVVAGCGLGKMEFCLDELSGKKAVIDADLCYRAEILKLLERNKELVLTPHPKEFASLLKIAGICDIDTREVQKRRFELAKMWSQRFESVLVLKGANTIISQNGKIYVMDLGSAKLSKGGSGDVLAGLIGGLLAQGYSTLDAAICGTLAHALAAKKSKTNSYALDPLEIIKEIKCL